MSAGLLSVYLNELKQRFPGASLYQVCSFNGLEFIEVRHGGGK